MKNIFKLILIFCSINSFAQRTVGLIDYNSPNENGYVLFSPIPSFNTYLIDKCGEKIHEWASTYRPALSVYLLNDGSLLRTGDANNSVFTSGGSGGIIEKFDWNGNLLWSYTISDSNQCQHHDIAPLPNGNILVIVWDRYDSAQAVANGKNLSATNAYLWSEKIIELQPVGTNSANIIWEWKLWEHLVQEFDSTKLNYDTVSNHPELVNINYFNGPPTSQDWIHFNSIDYNSTLDQILISSHNLCEIWVIDHSTTTAQAATHTGGNSGKGGDILYRWGNPQVYGRGIATDKKLFGQHHATWIPNGFPNAGKILVFNNGLNRPVGNYSSLDMIETPIDITNQYPIGATTSFLPTNLFWTYTAPVPTDFYGSSISGAYPLQNGSFMIANGQKGTFFEIDSMKQTIWKYINPVNNTGTLSQGTTPTANTVFRCNFYSPTFPGLIGQTLTPLGEIELNPIVPSICDSLMNEIDEITFSNSISIYPNPSNNFIYISKAENNFEVEIINTLGKSESIFKNTSTINVSNLSGGIYFLKINSDKNNFIWKFIKQ